MPIIREVGKNLPLAKEGFTWARCVIGYLFMCLGLVVCCRARAILSITVPPAAQPRGRRLGGVPLSFPGKINIPILPLGYSASPSCPWDAQHPCSALGSSASFSFLPWDAQYLHPALGSSASPSCPGKLSIPILPLGCSASLPCPGKLRILVFSSLRCSASLSCHEKLSILVFSSPGCSATASCPGKLSILVFSSLRCSASSSSCSWDVQHLHPALGSSASPSCPWDAEHPCLSFPGKHSIPILCPGCSAPQTCSKTALDPSPA